MREEFTEIVALRERVATLTTCVERLLENHQWCPLCDHRLGKEPHAERCPIRAALAPAALTADA